MVDEHWKVHRSSLAVSHWQDPLDMGNTSVVPASAEEILHRTSTRRANMLVSFMIKERRARAQANFV
jgi:hypothetical protein